MRNFIQIAESMNGPDEDTIHYYLSEGCGAFAYALWVAKGKPHNGDLGLISNDDGEPWFGDPESDEPTHDAEATHVFYIEPDGRTIDVLGYRDTNEMISGFHIHASVLGPWNPDAFAHEWMGDSDDVPLYCTYEMIQEALKVITKYPNIYGLEIS